MALRTLSRSRNETAPVHFGHAGLERGGSLCGIGQLARSILIFQRLVRSRQLFVAELKQRSLINEHARAADQIPDFSSIIRQGLPRSD